MSSFTRYRTFAAVAGLLAAATLSAAAAAAGHTTADRAGKSASIESAALAPHQHRENYQPTRLRPPASSLRMLHRSDYDLPDSDALAPERPSSPFRAKAACDSAQFAALSGSALVDAVKAADTECVNSLFGLSGNTAYSTFREAQMTTIATALRSAAASYNGTNAGRALQLILFLRAGYYVQYYDPSTVGSYGATLRNAIRPALDAFAANANFNRVDDAHGEVLSEYVILLDSSAENARYLYVVKRVLGNYNPTTFAPYYWMKAATNNAYTVLFRGHQDAAFASLVQSDTSIVDTLYTFANTHFARLGQDDGYLVANAGRELGRFLRYSGTLQTLARSRAKTLLDRSSVTGSTAALWVGVGEMIDHYDKANCSYYDLCDFQQRLAAAVLPISHPCSATLRIRAQSMSQSELQGACTSVAGQENYFHAQVASNRVPVADDNNSALEMVVFDSSDDYGTYAGALFGIDTNNGGMYLEGDPSVAGNQARFIAYEAEWVRPAFEIWNLTHEYVHYLDGRFDMYGDFSAAMSQKTVWWVEGFAEYMSYGYRSLTYSDAVAEAAAGTHALSTIFQNDYDSGTNRVYRWGYLAVRFMFEKHRGDVSGILGHFRPGNYTGYATFMNGIGARYDTEFRSFLACVANPDGSGCSGGTNVPPVANFSFAANGLAVTFTDASSDSDGSVVSRSWSFGDGSTSTATNPGKTYAAAGSYTVTLAATDNRGATHSVSKTVTVAAPPTGGELQNGVARTGLSAAQGAKLYFTIDVPAGATNLRVALGGGSGDADLYLRYGSAPTTTAYDCRPYLGGNAETCTVAAPQAGRYHVMLDAYSAFSGASLVASFTPPAGLPECAGSDVRVLGKNCQRSNLAAAAGNIAYFYLQIPAGTTQLQIRASGGSGDANLYANAAGWATPTSYQRRSINAGNGETLTIANPPAGYYYISLHAASAFSGVTLSTEY
ncbi:MAG TPA: collagenase [Tahibacter sp.]|uniref:collagenase n=1 Tax=Tahibacter sp. TaxID=2056211 RepID=UPI002D0DED03|nr:collagenase [Tahibacter sp.]HSX62771.1 collagenase [Tahibacter sp.]